MNYLLLWLFMVFGTKRFSDKDEWLAGWGLVFAILLGIVLFRRYIKEDYTAFLERRHYDQDQLDYRDSSFKRPRPIQALSIAAYRLHCWIANQSLMSARWLTLFFLAVLLGLHLYRRDIFPFPPVSAFFRDNIVPELVGFALDGLLITGVLALLKERKEEKEREVIRIVVRRMLIPYLHDINNHLFETKLTSGQIREGKDNVNRVLNNFVLEAFRVDEAVWSKFTSAVQERARRDLPTARAMIPLMTQMSTEHLDVWMDVVMNLEQMEKAGDKRGLSHVVIELLGNMIEFEHNNFGGWRSKLNIQQQVNLR